jgi:hypothetical protein
MSTYEAIPSRVWRRDDGRTASPYGACPWTSKAEAARWKLEQVGWTVRDNRTGTIGLGRAPYKTEAEAEDVASRLNIIAAAARADREWRAKNKAA